MSLLSWWCFEQLRPDVYLELISTTDANEKSLEFDYIENLHWSDSQEGYAGLTLLSPSF